MREKILHFIKYHNAVTIVFVMIFFSFGVSYAASPAVRDSVYSSKETVVSVDNNLITFVDLDNFSFNLRINSITEDEKKYYVIYSYQTLTIEDGVWQNKEVEKTFKLNKEALGERDLGLYVAEELGENMKYELSYLKRVQKLEKGKGESRKIVAVEYSGLIGKLLNPKENVIEGYIPVVQEAPEPAAAIVVHPPPKPQETSSEPISPQAISQPEAGPPEVETPVQATSTLPTLTESEVGTPTSTPSSVGAETELATSTPEVIPEVIQEPIQEPVIEVTSTPETVPSE
jgi:hypothetical protein